MKLIITANEVSNFAKELAPVMAYADADINSTRTDTEQPTSNMTGKMIQDILELMTSKGLVAEEGPMSVSITNDGDLCIEIKEEFTIEFTEVYFKSVLRMVGPVKALIEVMQVQQKEMDTLSKKWFPQPLKMKISFK